jgi:hypothetical protein
VASIENIEENRLVAMLLKGAREDHGRVQVTGGIESDEADARQSPIPQRENSLRLGYRLLFGRL